MSFHITSKLLVLSLPFLIFACAPATATQSRALPAGAWIINGQPVSVDSPIRAATVALGTSLNRYSLKNYPLPDDVSGSVNPDCTGTLLTRELVLTAAHCLPEADGDYTYPVIFAHDLGTTITRKDITFIKNFKLHPAYKPHSRLNDLALVQLEEAAPATFQPVAVLSISYPLAAGTTLTLAGFGQITEDDGARMSPILRSAEIALSRIEDHMLIADQTKGFGGCHGDSGGPAFLNIDQKLYLMGVTEGPYGDYRDCRHEGMFTYAADFESFILEAARSFGSTAPTFAQP